MLMGLGKTIKKNIKQKINKGLFSSDVLAVIPADSATFSESEGSENAVRKLFFSSVLETNVLDPFLAEIAVNSLTFTIDYNIMLNL